MNATIASQQSSLRNTTELPISLWISTQPQPLPEGLTFDAASHAETENTCDQTVADNMPMVRFLARQMHARLPQHVELDDLISAGTLGLVDAAARFDGKRSVQFRSYAQIRIRGAMLDSLRTSDWSPRVLRRQGREVEQVIRILASRGVHSPTDAEVAEEMGLSLPHYQQLLRDLKGLEIGSLQLDRNEETGEQEMSYIPGSPADDPFFCCLQGELRDRLTAAIDTLPEKERLVLTLYYHEELTMREISQVLGVVESRVSQMHSSAVLRLRSVLGGKNHTKQVQEARSRHSRPMKRIVCPGTSAARQQIKNK